VQVAGLPADNPVSTGNVLAAPLKSTVALAPLDFTMPVKTLPPLTVVCALQAIAQRLNATAILPVMIEVLEFP
jgi:hypothetical protein